MRGMGTWLLVCTCISLGVLVPGEGGGLGAGTFTCVTNNILRIDCHWSAPELGQGPRPWLLFTSNHAPGSKHRCVFWARTCAVVLPPEEVLGPSDNFTITLHHHISGKERVSLVDPQYLPRRHVKLDPPSDVRSNVSADACVLTWSISPALGPLASLLEYELAFRRKEEAWERAQRKGHIVGVTWITLEAVEFDPGSTYEARLRVQMSALGDAVAEEERYEGQWSHLVSPLWQPNSPLVAVSVFLLLSSLTYLLFKLSPRVKRTFYQNVPSPAAFFQPLYSVHNGNFQTWTGARRAGVQVSHDPVNVAQEASESSVWEAIASLTYDAADPWPFMGLEEGSGRGLPADVLPEALEWAGQPPAYLPQEEWVLASLTRPAPPQSEGSGSDYCALGCPGECQPSPFLGNMPSSGPNQALACGLSCDQQSLDARQRSNYVGASYSQRQDPGEQTA